MSIENEYYFVIAEQLRQKWKKICYLGQEVYKIFILSTDINKIWFLSLKDLHLSRLGQKECSDIHN